MTDLTPERLAGLREHFEMRAGLSSDGHADNVLAMIAALEAANESKPTNSDTSGSANERELADLRAALEAKTAEVERLTPKQPDGWSTQDRQEAKQEAERRWPNDRDGYQSDFDRGGINGFILGAEWQKARETFISYKTIAGRAEAALERVRALHPRKEFDDSPGKFYCDACQRTAGLWPCPTVQAIEGSDDD